MEQKETPGQSGPNTTVPIVGIGASAGGLYALKCFLAALPKDFGFAIVFLQHLSPTHRSLLPELLTKGRPHLEVLEIADNMEVLPNKLFLCPPGKEIRIQKGFFHLTAPQQEHVHLPIDEFFISLAEAAEDRAIAVILSGAGTDGARGIQAIRRAGGTVFVQDPSTAEFPGMPLAAISTGQVDEILKPEDISREIVKLAEAGAVRMSQDDMVSAAQFETFYGLIREKTGYRFNHYKQSVVNRRIRRRMYLSGVTSVQDYIQVVTDREQEAAALAADLMIGVTSFFRDQLAWKALKVEVIRHLVASEEDSPVRVWTPACASGEEAYSIAMLLHHELALAGRSREIQVFATDVNDRALEKAREGTYPASIAADVPADLMRKYFTGSEDGQSVVISKELRERVVFAKQDLMTDPPFSRLDLILCRNFLIYLEPDAQEKSIALFHYALKDGGYLFLGNAESTGRNSALFKSVGNKKCRVYRKLERTPSTRLPLSVPFAAERAVSVPSRQALAAANQPTITEFIQNSLLEEYAPAAIAINQSYDILYHNGPTNRYLLQPRGMPTQNLLLLLPENLRSRVRGAIYRAAQEAKPVSIRVSFPNDGEQPAQSPPGKKGSKKSSSPRKAAKKSGAVLTKGEKGDEQANRTVTLRIAKLRENIFLLVFQEKRGVSKVDDLSLTETAAVDETVVRQLESELSATRADLQTNIEQLKGLNEELQSSNEELQAANEELETSREELQSLNEELLTVNTQLQAKIEEQDATNNDLNNFLTSTNIPTIFLDPRFRVKRFTPAMSKLLKLIPSDVGRPIVDMSQENLGADLIADAQSVLDSLVPIRKEIAVDGLWYIRATLPYRTSDSRIEGVIITYTDITDRKKDEEIKGHLSAIVESSDEAIISKDLNGMIQTWNAGAEKIFGYTAQEATGRNISFLIPPGHVDEVPEILKRIAQGEHIEQFETVRMRKDGMIIPVSLTFSPIRDSSGRVVGVSKIAHDISARQKAEEQIKHLASFPQLNPNPICEVDSEGNVTFCNPATLKMLADFGRADGDVALLLPADIEEILKGLEKKSEALFYREVSIRDRVFGETIHLAPQFKVIRIYAYDITKRKRAEEELRKSEELFRLAMNNMPDAIAIYDAERRYEFVNAAGLRRSGKPLEYFVGRRIDEMYDEEMRNTFWPALMRTYETGTSQTVEATFTMPTGQYDLIITFVPMSKDGQVYRVLNFTFDITERKKAEAEIQALARQRQVALDAARLGWWQYDPITRVAEWDDGYKSIFGVSGYTRPNDEILVQIIHPDDLAGLWARVEAALNPVDPQPYAVEYRINRPDGALRWIEAHGIATFEGEGADRWAVNLVGTVADITDRKLAEQTLRESEERFRSVLDNSRDVIYRLNVQTGRYEYISPSAERVLGYSADELMAQDAETALAMIHPDDLAAVRAAHARLEETGEGDVDYRQRTKSGEYRWLSNHISLTRDSAGRPLYRSGNLNDITERKKAEEELARSNQRVNEIIASIQDDFYVLDHDWNFTYASRQFTAKIGKEPEDFIGNNIWKMFPNHLGTVFEENLHAAMEKREIRRFDIDGKYTNAWYRMTAFPSPEGITVLGTDITERKNAEDERDRLLAEVQRHVAELDAVFKVLPYLVSVHDQDGKYLRVNQAVIDLFGFDPTMATREEIARRVKAHFPDGRPLTPENMPSSRALSGETVKDVEYVITNERGEEHVLLFNAIPLMLGDRVYGAVFSQLDITERKNAETSLQHSLQRFELLSRTAGELLQSPEPQKAVVTLCGQVMEHLDCHVFFNFLVEEKAGRLHLNACAGISEEEARRIEWLDFGVAVCGCVARDCQRIIAEHIPTTPDERTELVKSYGIKAYCCHPILGPGGAVIGTLSFGTKSRETFSDDDLSLMKAVTDQVAVAMTRMRGEQVLRNRTEELEASNKELEAFIYSVSHDLRAPLRTMSGFSKILIEDFGSKLEDQPKDYLTRITNASVKMTELIDDLLRLSRISKQDMDRMDYDLSRLASSIATTLREQDPGRSVEVAIAEGLRASVDPNLMRVALANLIDNAWKFTSKAENARIEFGAFDKDGKTVYFVKDNGAGFDQQYAYKMFWPFHRLHSESEFEGTGIGLAIVERIIRRHGGKVWAEGEVGRGATVYFTLG